MEQINWNDAPPSESGPYVTSISRKLGHGGDYVFTYVAYFDVEQGVWHKFNPWEDNGSGKGDLINDRILGWFSNATYLGVAR